MFKKRLPATKPRPSLKKRWDNWRAYNKDKEAKLIKNEIKARHAALKKQENDLYQYFKLLSVKPQPLSPELQAAYDVLLKKFALRAREHVVDTIDVKQSVSELRKKLAEIKRKYS